MGYNTDYSLEDTPPELDMDILEALENFGVDTDLARNCDIKCKWYKHEEDMLELSAKFPETVFTLSGIGEDYPDIWKKRFINGQVDEVRADIVFPDFPPLP